MVLIVLIPQILPLVLLIVPTIAIVAVIQHNIVMKAGLVIVVPKNIMWDRAVILINLIKVIKCAGCFRISIWAVKIDSCTVTMELVLNIQYLLAE